MTMPIAMLNAGCTHGAVVITGSPDRYVNGLPVVRMGDLVSCPLQGHGINPIVAVHVIQQTDNRPPAHSMAVAACGATIITASFNVYVG